MNKYYLIIENYKYKIIIETKAIERDILTHIYEMSNINYSSLNEYLFINHKELDNLKLYGNEITEKLMKYIIKKDLYYSLYVALTSSFYINDYYLKSENELKEKLSRFKKPIINLILLEEYIGEINNGGHEQYFTNSSVYGFKMLLDALIEMELYTYREILNSAIEIFKPSLVRDENYKTISPSKQKFLGYLDNIFYTLDMEKQINKYFLKNINNIVM